MYLNYEDLIVFDDPVDVAVEPLSSDETRRIKQLTLQKAGLVRPARRRRLLRTALIAAVLALVLSVTGYAAYENGWFGFDRLFGKSAEIVSENVQNYSAAEEGPASADTRSELAPSPSFPSEDLDQIARDWAQDFSQPFPAAIAAGPYQAVLDPATSTAETDLYRYRLDALLVSPDTLMALLHVEPKTDAAADFLATVEDQEALSRQIDKDWFHARCEHDLSGMDLSNHDAELLDGGMSSTLLQKDETGVELLLLNVCGQFTDGDPLRFRGHEQAFTRAADLFDLPLEGVIRDCKTVELDASRLPESGRPDSLVLTVSPISLSLEAAGELHLSVSVTLKDGTKFSLWGEENGHRHATPGSYGSLAMGSAGKDGSFKQTWAFSQFVDPEQIQSVTVNGVEYPIS